MPIVNLVVSDQLGNPYYLSVNSADNSLVTTPAPGVSPSTNDNSISQSAYQIIASALRLIGVLASGELIPIEEANDGLNVLQQMLDAWNAERLTIFTTPSQDFAFTLGQQSYTLGIGGNFDVARPPKITGMSAILLQPNPLNPIEIPIVMYSAEQWQNEIPVKVVNSTFPQICYDDGGFPLRTLNFWPIPQLQQNNVRIYGWQGLGLPTTLQSVLSFPPGYAQAFRYNLAVLLAAEFAAPVSPTVQAIAIESLARVKTMNAPELGLRSDLIANPAGYNYKADLFGIPF